MAVAKKTTTKKAAKKVASAPEQSAPVRSSYIVEEKKVDYQTRTVLLLDARNELVPVYFSGASKVAPVFKTEAINPFVDYLYTTCKAFVETLRDYSIQIASPKKSLEFGVGDILVNKKKQMRLVINLHRDPKTKELFIMWVDPNNAKAPRQNCSLNTIMGWVNH
jgi:hypothetical protein